MGLHVTQNGNDLHVQWNRQSAAIQKARRGVLAINDGVYTKSVSLDADHLQTGSVVYRYSSGDVRFRLEVYPRERTTVAQDVEWRGAPATPEPASPSPEPPPS
jgi:hypothetical protein